MPNSSLLRGSLAAAVLTLGSFVVLSQAFAADKATPANGKLVAHVVDPSGSPRAGAIVRLFIRDNATRLLLGTVGDRQTDANGIATFDHLATDQFYFLRAEAGQRLLAYRATRIDSDEPPPDVELNLAEPRSAVVHVRDKQGKPIAGADVSEIDGHTAKSWLPFLYWPDFPKVGIITRPSNADGELTVERLPEGSVSLHLRHANFAPALIDKLATTSGAVNKADMSPGAIVELRFKLPKGVSHVENLKINWAQVEFWENDTLPSVSADKPVKLMFERGKYTAIYANHPEFAVTPEYRQIGKQFELHAGVNVLSFDVRMKTKIHGRVLDQATGKPLAGISLVAYATPEKVDGPFADFAWPKTRIEECTTGPHGEYEIRVPSGPGLISLSSLGMIDQHDGEKINVAADGSTIVPDILVRPIPKIHGIVRDSQGRPVAGAVVRFRNSEAVYWREPPALTDSNGRFELSCRRIPIDWVHQQPRPIQTVLAFDPYRPLGAVAPVNLLSGEPQKDIELRLSAQDFSFPVGGFAGEAEMYALLSPGLRKIEAEQARGGMPAPELDGAEWLNASKPKMSLADFRDKYLLLHFWTTWCGNCPADLQCVELVNKLYRDRGLAVVLVHDNSVPTSEIKKYVADNKIHFPVVVDQLDGRILAAYRPHGATGYPSDVLIGPDGRIVGHPPGTYRTAYRIELLRQQIMTDLSTSKL